jgi:hypothetical protein
MTQPKGVPKAKPKRPATAGSFTPGKSGNPGGRPKAMTEIRELAREHGPWAILRLRELAEGEDGKVAVAAVRELLDRGYGRPVQAVEVDARVHASDPRELLESLLGRVAARGDAPAVDPEPEPDRG